MNRYAANTEVQATKSRADIEAVLMKNGARAFAYATDIGIAKIGFRILNDEGAPVAVSVTLPLPNPSDDEFVNTPTGKARTLESSTKAYEQACRASWRQLLLIVKAKMEAVKSGISTIEREFMPDLVIGPGGRTLEQWMSENYHAIEAGGELPMLPGGST